MSRIYGLRYWCALTLILVIGFATALISWRYPRLWLDLLLIPPLLLGYHYRSTLSPRLRRAWLVLAALVIVIFALWILYTIVTLIARPPEWDFKLYWTYGRASASGLNPYVQDNLLRLAAPLNLSDLALAELFFFQTPPSLFLYTPLGWFDIHTAFALWSLAQCAVLAAVIFLLWKLLLADGGRDGLLLTAALTLLAFATLFTLRLGQVNYVLMLFLLLFWRDRQRPRAGLWLALAVFVKPVAVFFFLYLFARRHWRAMTASIATMAVASLATILVYGPEMFFGYFVSNPIANDMPSYLYTELVNQSLLAAILRVTQFDLSTGSPLIHPLFLVLAAVLTVVTGWLAYRMSEQDEQWALALTVFFALLVFPKTLYHYGFITLAPVLLLWSRRHLLPDSPWSAVTFILLLNILLSNQNGVIMTWGLAFGYLCFAAISAWLVARQPSRAPVTPELLPTQPHIN